MLLIKLPAVNYEFYCGNPCAIPADAPDFHVDPFMEDSYLMNRFQLCSRCCSRRNRLHGATPKAEAQGQHRHGCRTRCPTAIPTSVTYPCAPYGYYSPEMVRRRCIVGAGPWVHGPDHLFRGHVGKPVRCPPRLLRPDTANRWPD